MPGSWLSRSALVLGCVSAARVARKGANYYGGSTTKLVAGVPVFNSAAASIDGNAGVHEAQVRWTVVLTQHVSDAKIEELCSIVAEGCESRGHPDAGGVPYLQIKGTEQDLESLLRATPAELVKFAEPGVKIHVPELELVGEEVEVGAASTPWNIEHVAAPAGNQGAGVNVYVLDSGIHTTHTEFEGRAVLGPDYSGSYFGSRDMMGHGTHVAGTVAGKTVGVAPKATVTAVKVLHDSGSGELQWAIDAMDFIAVHAERPAVASMSFGIPGMYESLNSAVQVLTDANVIVVIASGNSDEDACGYSPAVVSSAITVGAMTSTNERSHFSNYGMCVDIWAPGTLIRSATVSPDPSGMWVLNGTSMACPHVSGGAATLLSDGVEPSGVLAALRAKAKKGVLSGLKAEDTNELMFLGGA